MELTDDSGGEGYARYPTVEGEVILGDRAYATARGIYAVKGNNAHVVARLNPHNLRICNRNRERIFMLERENEVPKTGAIEFDIVIPVPPEKRSRSHKSWILAQAVAWIPARIVAGRTRNGDVIWILTTLSSAEASALRILELYRLRWQIELLFKRLKSLLHLDTLPSRRGPKAKSWMLARLLAAALAQKLVQPSGPFSPWGYELREERIHA